MTCFTSRLLYCCLVPSEPFHVEFASYVKDILRREASSTDLLVRPSVRPFIEPLVCFSSNCFCIIDLLLLLLLLQDLFFIYRVLRKNYVFSQFTVTPPSSTSLFKALNAMPVYCHSYWLVFFFCTTNSSRMLTGERWQNFGNSWKKTQYLMNTL